ncbi:MAG TPA: tetratricopeptide repeat-containing protein kinase family protein, partial [Polyangiaceae bacterium]|nr:tetratricopeptide repeat-containing protein kinase family protein [Polyangiaceae bacterium]
VRVVDFGLARLVESASGPGEPPPRASLPATPKRLSELTATGALLGTPSYMAPEQWRRAAVDARTDHFSFCVALYAALYGERPFAGDDAAAAAVATASAARVRRAPRGTKVPGHVRRALLRGLAAAPGDRFPSMDALLAALAHEPPRPARAAAVSALVAAGIACGALLARRRAEAPRPCAAGEARVAQVWGPARRRAVGEALRHTGAPYAATVAGEAVDVLDRYAARWAAQYGEACAAPRGEQGEEATRLRVECLDDRLREFKALGDRLLEADAGVAEQAVQAAHRLSDLDACSDAHAPAAPPPSDPATRSEVDALRDALVEARSLMQAGRYRDGLAAARPLADRARQTGYRPVEAEALYLVGALAERSGDFAAAERDLEQATLAAEAGRHDELTAQALGDLIFVRGGRLARYESLDLLERRAFAVLERLGTPGELEAPLRVSLGQVNLMRSRYPEAERNLARALTLLERRYGPDDVRLIGPLAARGWLDLHRHEAPAARASFERALALALASLGDDHPEAARMMGGLAEALRLGGEYGEAEALYRRELAIYEHAFGPDSHQTINALNDLALLYGAQRRYADAVPLHERAVALAERGRGPDHPATAICLASLGAALAERGGRGDLAASLAALRRAVATLGRHDSEDPQRYADALLALSSTQSKLGRPSAALATALHGLDVYQRAPGSEGPPPHALHTLGAIYLRLRRPARAIAPLEAALESPRRAGGHAPELARTTALLARALGESGRAPARARALALEAHAALANEPTPAPELAALERWMRKRGIRPSGAPPPPGRAPAPR